MQEPIYMLLARVSLDSGGVTRNVLHRARVLAEKTGQPVTLLTLDYTPDLPRQTALMRDSGLLSSGVELRNFVDEMDFASRDARRPLDDASAQSAEPQPGPSNTQWVYMDGPALTLPSCNARTLAPIDSIVRDFAVRELCDPDGTVRVLQYVSKHASFPFQTLHLDANGSCFLALWSDEETRRSTGAFLFSASGLLESSYASVRDAQARWVQAVISVHDKAVAFTDWRHSDSVLLRVDHPGVATIKTLHINHLADPRTYGAPLQPRTIIELSRIDRFDAFIALSESQLADIARQFGPRTTYHVVRHSIPQPRFNGHIERDPLLVVGIGRYHAFKRWDRAIEAFALVVRQVPEARLELWGFGPEEKRYRELIVRLGLSTNVSIKGITHDAQRVLAGAAISVLTSPAEAFGLVTGESMRVGTPMVAFDVTYGLRDQITSGVNGVLVPHPDTEMLADAIVDLLTHPAKRRTMGRKAQKSARVLDEQTWADQWLSVIAAAREQRDHRVALDIQQAVVSVVRRSRKGVTVLGSIRMQHPKSEPIEFAVYAKTRAAVFSDSYGNAQELSRSAESTTRSTVAGFKGAVRLHAIDQRSTTWDLFVSISSRNAHRFVRLAVDSDTVLASWADRRFTYEPYVTKKGNLSVIVKQAKAPRGWGARMRAWLGRGRSDRAVKAKSAELS